MFRFKRIFYFILCAAVAVSMSCGSKETPSFKGKITFLKGSAQIQSADGKIKQLAFADDVEAGSEVKTDTKSYIFIQFGETSVVKMQENSTLKIGKLISVNNMDLHLEQGQVLSKINKLGKGESFSIMTPTTVASVRGTQFSVSYGEGRTDISVAQGRVNVGVKKETAADLKETVESDYIEVKDVDAGKTAYVDKIADVNEKKAGSDLIVINDINENQKSVLKDIETVPIIEKPDSKKPEEIKEIYKPVIEVIEKSEDISTSVKKPLTQAEKTVKIKQLIQKKTVTEAEIRETFDRIDEITLFNKNIIRGAIISRGDNYTVLTAKGTIKIKQDDISNIRVIK